jgi:hypothetical protein
MNDAPATYLKEAALRQERTRSRVRRCDELAYSAWRRIARSYQRITALPPIAGGADDELRDRIRGRLADGTLPRVTGRAWAGKGDASAATA